MREGRGGRERRQKVIPSPSSPPGGVTYWSVGIIRAEHLGKRLWHCWDKGRVCVGGGGLRG